MHDGVTEALLAKVGQRMANSAAGMIIARMARQLK
jgi:hypothetical protein